MSLNIEFSEKVFPNKRRKPEEFKEIATEIRRDIIKSLFLAKSGHTGGPLGITDVLSVLFFGGNMHYNPNEPNWKDRDRFMLSAGHLCPVLYSILARAGYYPCQELASLRKYGTRLQGHPALDSHLPGLESSAGSLGQGISIAVGMAISDKLLDKSDRNIFCLTGDGELEEGSVWEAAMSASNFKLDNLCWIVDSNDCQIDGRVHDVMAIEPLDKKFEAFNFNTIVIDGNNFAEIQIAFDKFLENSKMNTGKPTVIIAKTYMGKGVSFMEDKYSWHGMPPNESQTELALKELI